MAKSQGRSNGNCGVCPYTCCPPYRSNAIAAILRHTLSNPLQACDAHALMNRMIPPADSASLCFCDPPFWKFPPFLGKLRFPTGWSAIGFLLGCNSILGRWRYSYSPRTWRCRLLLPPSATGNGLFLSASVINHMSYW